MRNGLRIRIKYYTSVQCETFNTGSRGCNDQLRKSTELKKKSNKILFKMLRIVSESFPSSPQSFLEPESE